MIGRLLYLSLRFRVLVIGVAVLILVEGASQLRAAPVDVLPEFSPPAVQIQAEAPGLSAAEVEQLITIPIEHDLLNGVAWLDQIQSESYPGLSAIDLTFKPGTDLLKARQVVQERMSQAHALPAVGNPPVMIQPQSSTSRVMMIGLSSKELSMIDLSVLARWKIRPRLMGVPGVANVTIWGQRDRQLKIQVDPVKLQKNGVTLTQVITTAGNALWVSPLTFVEASTPGTGGFIDTAAQRFSIQHVSPITTAQGLSEVTIVDDTGRALRLGQVASVVEDHQPLVGDAVVSDGPGLMLVVQKFPGANSDDITQGIEQALQALRPGLSGVEIKSSVFQADSYIQSALRNLGVSAALAIIFLAVLVGLALFSWRAALISVVAVLLSLITATYVLYELGMTLNLMVLAGLCAAVGVIVGDVVVDVARIRTHVREQKVAGDEASRLEQFTRALTEARRWPIYATLIVLLAPLPAVFLDGTPGSFARPAVTAYVVAVLVSSAVALTVTPILAFLLLWDGRISPRRSPLARLMYWLFDRCAPQLMRRRTLTYATVGALALAGGYGLTASLEGGPMLPALLDRNLLVHVSAMPGTSLTEMVRVTTAVAKDLESTPGVKQVSAEVGRSVSGDQIVDINSGELWLTIAKEADLDATVASIRGVLRQYPGLASKVTSYPEDQVAAAQHDSGHAFVVRIYGQDFTIMRAQADKVRHVISSVGGVVDPRVQAVVVQPTVEVQVDLAAAQRFGINPGDVRRAATTYFSGLLVGSLYQDQTVFDVVVRGSNAESTPADVANLLIDSPDGGTVRVGDIATVAVVSNPTFIAHDATLRSIDVTGDVRGRDLGSVLADVTGRVQALSMPLEVHAEVSSDVAQQQTQGLQTAGLALAVAVAIYLVLQAAFASWRVAAFVFAALPLAGAGELLAVRLVGAQSRLGVLVGLLLVLGIATRNSVMLVRSFRRLESTLGRRLGVAGVTRVTRENLASVLLTTAATAAVFLPVLLVGPVAGTELLHPLSIDVLAGLVTVTLVSLFVIPTLYTRLAPAPSGAAMESI